ncbi:hypothetical protein AB0L13_46015 [Saccharopolyspora shandongensis]|uniref:hypothetical protein n=1 Tax=Saccharopolyspora shandongensis TaxID=418495 RepID=UPI0034324AA3
MVVAADALRGGVSLAWRAGVDRVELRAVADGEVQGVALDELAQEARLRREIDTDNVEAGAPVPLSRATGTAEEVEQSFGH